MDWVAASRTVKISGLAWSNCWHRPTCLLLVSPPESCRRRQPVVGSFPSQCKELQCHEWEMERAKCFTLPPFITAAMTRLRLGRWWQQLIGFCQLSVVQKTWVAQHFLQVTYIEAGCVGSSLPQLLITNLISHLWDGFAPASSICVTRSPCHLAVCWIIVAITSKEQNFWRWLGEFSQGAGTYPGLPPLAVRLLPPSPEWSAVNFHLKVALKKRKFLCFTFEGAAFQGVAYKYKK